MTEIWAVTEKNLARWCMSDHVGCTDGVDDHGGRRRDDDFGAGRGLETNASLNFCQNDEMT
jgi:hypothetical protein